MEASGLDFGASGPQFWSFHAPLVERKGFFLTSRGAACFWNRFGRFFRSCVLAAMGEVLTEWVAGGVPPLGAFNGIGAKLAILASKLCGVAPFEPW